MNKPNNPTPRRGVSQVPEAGVWRSWTFLIDHELVRAGCECRGRQGHKKVRYDTEASARAGAERYTRERQTRYRFYKCPHSDAWHLTTKDL